MDVTVVVYIWDTNCLWFAHESQGFGLFYDLEDKSQGQQHCILYHLKTLENASKSSFLYYYNGAQKHEKFVDFEKACSRAKTFKSHPNHSM